MYYVSQLMEHLCTAQIYIGEALVFAFPIFLFAPKGVLINKYLNQTFD
jgi:hypothetical protein